MRAGCADLIGDRGLPVERAGQCVAQSGDAGDAVQDAFLLVRFYLAAAASADENVDRRGSAEKRTVDGDGDDICTGTGDVGVRDGGRIAVFLRRR